MKRVLCFKRQKPLSLSRCDFRFYSRFQMLPHLCRVSSVNLRCLPTSLITNTPGIGKSHSFCCFLRLLLLQNNPNEEFTRLIDYESKISPPLCISYLLSSLTLNSCERRLLLLSPTNVTRDVLSTFGAVHPLQTDASAHDFNKSGLTGGECAPLLLDGLSKGL